MNYAKLLAARLSDVERGMLLLNQSEGAIIAAYHNYRAELSGGHLRGGTEEQGIAEMREVFQMVRERARSR